MDNPSTPKKRTIGDWYNSLTPEQKEAHKAKLVKARKEAQAKRKLVSPSSGSEGAAFTPDVSSRAGTALPPPPGSSYKLDSARHLLSKFLDAVQCRTGGGEISILYCRLCVGTGVHMDKFGCDCICHLTRSFLTSLIDSETPIERIK